MDDYKIKIDAAKSLFKRLGFEKTKDIAKKMDILPNTFTSNLKYIIKNERFDTSFARNLFLKIGITKDEFVVSINQKANDKSESSLSIIEGRSNLLNNIANSYQKEITLLINNLKDGDNYTLITTEQPWEFNNFYIRKVILSALKKGVSFRYIYPKVTDWTKEVFNKHEDKLEWRQLEGLHNSFVEQMINYSEDDEDFKSLEDYKDNPRNFMEQNLKPFFSEDTMLVHPRIKSMLIETRINGIDKIFAFSEATFGESFFTENNKPNTLWYPLPHNDTILMHNLIEKIIHE